MTDASNALAWGSSKVSKIDRYKWEVKDSPGVLLDIDKDELRIDPEYQRKSKEAKILAMARAWSWVGCGALLVADREGCFFVMDGQHRLLAARKRSDITTLPCIVFSTESAGQEAQGFLVSNTLRRPISGLDRFKALLVAGVHSARVLEELMDSAGRVPADKADGGSIRCLSTLVSLVEADENNFRKVWPLAVGICVNNTFHERIIYSLAYIEQRLPQGDSLTQKRWRDRLLAVGYNGLLGAINSSCVYHGQSAPKFWAFGVLNAINKGMRNKLEMEGVTQA
jgi:hypothetical protein